MKKLAFSLLVLNAYVSASLAQDNYIKPPTLGIQFFFNDFKGASYIKNNGLSLALRDKQLGQFKSMTPGIAINFLNGISNHFDLSANLAGSFLAYPIPNHAAFSSDKLLLEGDFSIHGKMFSDRYVVSPYLSAGVGASKYTGYYGAFVPLGVGLQVSLFDEAFLLVNSQYRVGITDNVANHLYHSIGFAGTVGKKKEAAPVPPPPPPIVEPPKDRDGDGIVDSLDACPDMAGLPKFNGCPDSDNDGIADKDDKCPNVPGVARYQGCPVPDRDKDGITDEEDKCPDVAGVARYQGCPVPDRDKDGVNDEEDKCPDLPGEVSNNGCPVIKAEEVKKIEYAAKNIFFTTGKYTLLSKSFKPLNEVVTILAENKDLKLDVDGYTDNTGKAETNQKLSQQRADAVKKYLVSKGIDESRLASTGHGQDSPVADNKTAAGRAQNRRVELHLKYY